MKEFPFRVDLAIERLRLIFVGVLISNFVSLAFMYLLDEPRALLTGQIVFFDLLFLLMWHKVVRNHYFKYRDASIVVSESGIELKASSGAWTVSWDSIKRIHVGFGSNVLIRASGKRPIIVPYVFDPRHIAETIRTDYCDKMNPGNQEQTAT